jgi:hypothetical protein
MVKIPWPDPFTSQRTPKPFTPRLSTNPGGRGVAEPTDERGNGR